MPMLPREMRKSAGVEEAQSPSPSRSQSPSPQREPSRFPSAKKLDHLEQAKQRRCLQRSATQVARSPTNSPARATAPGDGAAAAPVGAMPPMVPHVRVPDTDKAEVRRGRARNTDWSLEGTISDSGGAQSVAAGRGDLEGSDSSGMQLVHTESTMPPRGTLRTSAVQHLHSDILMTSRPD